MSIKGTLETFNLCELLQMLAFNQKEGTLVLESDSAVRTLFLDSGRLGFLEEDEGLNRSLLREAHRLKLARPDRLKTAWERHEESGRHLGGVFVAMGLVSAERIQDLIRDVTLEHLFECQLTAVAGFEFIEGKALRADRADGRPLTPLLSVESLLLDLARLIDHWNTVSALVPATGEIYEGTGIAVDLSERGEIDTDLADAVIPQIDGCRTVEAIAEACYATTYTTMHVVALLLDGGGVREVPTDDLQRRAEDLLARGSAEDALPLLRRCIQRGDAPVDVRIRLADALEACGQPAAAAAELDSYAALCDDDVSTAEVFEALSRALTLRGGDAATAARVCDYYLRRRPWLQDYTELATNALRDLIDRAARGVRPIDAAIRLKGFIDVGDQPPEELTRLADLFEEAGDREQAAEAMFAWAELLLADQRVPGAREALRRTLELDAGHANARRRLLELEGVRRRRGHRARIAVILFALAGVASAAGVAWFAYTDTSSTEISHSQTSARLAVASAESRALERIEAFRQQAEAAALLDTPDEELAVAAETMRTDVRAIMATTADALASYGSAIEAGQAAGKAAAHREDLDRYRQRVRQVDRQVTTVLDELAEEARAALAEALVHHRAGRFLEARRLLHRAWNLAFESPTTRAGAGRTLTMVDEYVKEFEALRDRLAIQTNAGKLKTAFTMGVEGLGTLLDSDLTRQLTLPVQFTSTPPGAEVWIGAEDTGQRTPCIVSYSPFREDRLVELRMPGRTPARATLPGYGQMRRDPESLATYEPAFGADLREGARWALTDPVDRFEALWTGSGLPLVTGDQGRLIYAISPRDGRMTPGLRLDPTRDGIRLAGRHGSGLEWLITGHRTLTVRTAQGRSWEQIAIGRMEHAPVIVDGLVVCVDELGTVYAYDANSGDPRWRVEIGSVPSQGVYASALGILLATQTGAAFRIDYADGKATPLAPAAEGAALVVPYGEGALLLGGGTAGCRFVDGAGKVTTMGDAAPREAHMPWVGAEGVAWIETDGVHWLAADAAYPVRLEGLGASADFVVGNDAGQIFAACSDGRLRAVCLATCQRPTWTAPLGGRADAHPVCLGDALYILVAGRLIAFDV